MRKLLTTSLIAMSLAFSASAIAKSHGYSTTVTEPVTTALKIEVVVSEDLAFRANNLPKKRSARSSSKRLNAAFANNGYYGEREIQRLTDNLQARIEHRFAKKGIEISDDGPTTLRVTIADARNNRPTHEQLTRDIGLSFLSSIALGGAEIESELLTADGRSLGTMNYAYYENEIREASFGGTWSDAHDAFRRYARRAAKTLSNSH